MTEHAPTRTEGLESTPNTHGLTPLLTTGNRERPDDGPSGTPPLMGRPSGPEGRRPATGAESVLVILVMGIDPGVANTGFGVVRWPAGG